MRFLKGHGTENDFVVIPDPDATLDLTAGLVRRLCDRRAGIGADGVLRAVPAKAVPDAAAMADRAEWFMDYRNADGSVAEMCGNGVRVFARYLADTGRVPPGGAFALATRAGIREVTLHPGGDVSVDMGAPRTYGESTATMAGRSYTGLAVNVGNPHLAALVTGPVADLDLSAPPRFDAAVFPGGANLELLRPLGERHVEMRVYERGSAETRSCGTGTVAAAVAAARAAGEPYGEWRVDVPGGTVTVTLTEETGFLRGPAVLVAEGELRPEWLAG
jgi:diaminopimelate epimerase